MGGHVLFSHYSYVDELVDRLLGDDYFIGDSAESGYVHRPDERKFVNYIRETRLDFDQIHLHSRTKLGHGLTLMQRNASGLPL